jgi:hypothetical protein
MKKAPAVAAVALFLSGCLGTPPIEETWTRIELVTLTPATRQELSGSAALSLEARMTFRELLTGFLVADLRSSTLSPSEVDLEDDPDDDEDGLEVAREVDRILGSSSSLAVEAIPITGFDHLIRRLTFELDAAVSDSSGSNLYLLVYFSDDVQEVEDGEMESIVVTPTLSTQRDILSAGAAIE